MDSLKNILSPVYDIGDRVKLPGYGSDFRVTGGLYDSFLGWHYYLKSTGHDSEGLGRVLPEGFLLENDLTRTSIASGAV
jgi:hypothetical protein